MSEVIHQNVNLVSEISGVGPKIKDSFNKAGIETIEDLLFCLPKSYEDRTSLTPLNIVKIGERVLCEGRIIKTQQNL